MVNDTQRKENLMADYESAGYELDTDDVMARIHQDIEPEERFARTHSEIYQHLYQAND
jgi:hypothetical protein